jgi:membrane protein implicated in regulation of membrane protease activity
MLTLAYIALALIGCGYILFATFTGHHGGGAGHAASGHAAGHTADAAIHYGVDGSGHAEARAGAATVTAFQFPFFSPLAVATLAAAVGGYGLIAEYGLRLRGQGSLLVALPAAIVTAYLVTYVSFRLVRSSTGTSAIRLSELAGARGEVITPIPAGGLGEVAAMVGDQRFTAPAREVDGREMARGARVTVMRMVGTTLVVTGGRE